MRLSKVLSPLSVLEYAITSSQLSRISHGVVNEIDDLKAIEKPLRDRDVSKLLPHVLVHSQQEDGQVRIFPSVHASRR